MGSIYIYNNGRFTALYIYIQWSIKNNFPHFFCTSIYTVCIYIWYINPLVEAPKMVISTAGIIPRLACSKPPSLRRRKRREPELAEAQGESWNTGRSFSTAV
jgi:hypothetical protein